MEGKCITYEKDEKYVKT